MSADETPAEAIERARLALGVERIDTPELFAAAAELLGVELPPGPAASGPQTGTQGPIRPNRASRRARRRRKS